MTQHPPTPTEADLVEAERIAHTQWVSPIEVAIAQALATARSEERDRCAKIAESQAKIYADMRSDTDAMADAAGSVRWNARLHAANAIAQAIRDEVGK